MSQVSPETAEWLDGPRLVEWLRANGLTAIKSQLGQTLERAVGRWRAGGKANVYVVDEVLVRLHLHLQDLPADLWVEAPPAGRRCLEIRDEVVQLVRAGLGPRAIAREIGCAPSTVRFHRDKAELV